MLRVVDRNRTGNSLQDDPYAEFRGRLEDPARRRRLLQLLTGGALACTPCREAGAFFWNSSSRKLADGRSVHSLQGEVTVNGVTADLQTRIGSGDSVHTGANSEIVFAVGGDAFLLRADSEMDIAGSGFVVRSLRILSGRLLSVFAARERGQALSLQASTATIGIRGTGVYVESQVERSYVCTCYGQAELVSSIDPADSELITSRNHDAPRYISRDASGGRRIREAPVINHDNEELKLLEAIVGRELPSGFGRRPYNK